VEVADDDGVADEVGLGKALGELHGWRALMCHS